jgi:prolipoprotein diacylglyceryl transferase
VISRNLARSIPSPSSSYIELGPLTLHFYALCIIAGIAVAIWLGDKRLRAVNPALTSVVADVAFFAVPSGIIGGRIYHVISDPSDYFGRGGNFLDAFAIWKYIGFIRAKRSRPEIDFPTFPQLLDALAPGILIAQAIGRIGNWFNVELFGGPAQGWWALEVPLGSRPRGYTEFETFHPTFAYEAIWCLLIATLLIVFTSRLRHGQTFALYIALYCLGRFFIEGVRIDSANEFFGLRQNEWVSVVIGLAALAIFAKLQKKSSKI